MTSRVKKTEMEINVTLDEPLTNDSCVKLITELIKYILYQKQQIPFTYESLIQLQAKVKPTDRNFSSIKSLLNTVKNVADQLTSQFLLRGCKVKEIVIIIGATILSPKLYIRLELPSEILDSRKHLEYQHSSRKPLLNLMRSMMECSEFQEAMASPLNPTNMFLLLQKSDSNSASEFFLPKPRYTPPLQASSTFIIRLNHKNRTEMKCNCLNLVPVYRELSESSIKENSNVQFVDHSVNDLVPYHWYQSKEVIKGFKFT